VKSYKYLGSILSWHKSTEEEIKDRIALSNKPSYANQKIFNRKLVSKKVQLKLYWAIIRSVIKYASETRMPKESMKPKIINN
jgi:hypothetical protein